MAALMAVGSFSSCSNDDDFLTGGLTDAQGRKAITFEVPFVNKATRAIVDNSTITDQTLRVYADRKDIGTENWSKVFDSTQLSFADGKWTPATPAFWYEYQDYRFVAVSPYSAPFSYTLDNGFVQLTDVPAVQESVAGTDYMVSNQYATTTNSGDRDAVNFTMSHMMAKLCLGIQSSGNYTVRLNSSKVWLPKEEITASYVADSVNMPREDAHCWTWSEFTNDYYVPSTDFKQYDCFADGIELTSTATCGKIYLIAPHKSLALFIDLDFDVLDADGNILRNKKIDKMPVKRSKMKMVSNTSYGITINVMSDTYADNIEFNEVSVNDWDAYDEIRDVRKYALDFTSTGTVYFAVDNVAHEVAANQTFSTNQKPTYFKACNLIDGYLYGNEELTSIDFADFDLSGVKNWRNMFYGDKNLKSIKNLAQWNKGQVTDISQLFCLCNSLTTIDDLSNLDISKCTSLRSTFYKCQRLTSVGDLRAWDTSTVTTFDGIFSHCNSLTELNLNGWNTSKVTRMCWMFDMADAGDTKLYDTWSKLTRLDCGGWDTSNVENFSFCFQDCDKLQDLFIDGWTITPWVVETPDDDGTSRLNGMFSGVNPTVTIFARGCDDYTIEQLRKVIPAQATLITD